MWCRNIYIGQDSINNLKQRNGRYHEEVKSLEESSFLIRNAIKTIENEPKEKEVSFQACYEIH